MAWVLGSTALVLMTANVVFIYLDRHVQLPEASDGWSLRSVFDIVVNMGVPILGIVIASRRPENLIGWLLLGAGIVLGLGGFARAYALHTIIADPGSLPGGLLAGWIPNAIWPIPVGLLPFLFLLFPDGQLPSQRWRPVRWFARVVLALILLTTIVFATSLWNTPFDLADRARSITSFALTVFIVVLIGLPIAIFLSFASLVVRYRGSVGEERLQLKWFVSAALVVAVTFSATIITSSPAAQTAFDAALLLLYAAIGVAILKHRLYDIDVILNKALVYGLLAGFITVVYVAVVVVIGTVVGATYLLAMVATAVIAIMFQPVRERAKRTANRLVYGERATPYEVLSGFSEHVGETYGGGDILPRMARLVAEGTGATDATVWLRVGPQWRPAASWPVPPEPWAPVASAGNRLPAFPGVDAAIPVHHGNELLGALTVTKPPKEALRPEEEKLLSDLAAQAGLVMQNFRLIEDLRSSRQRLVAAHDEERRRLERDLHDGAQQQLVALAVKVRMADRLVGTDAGRSIKRSRTSSTTRRARSRTCGTSPAGSTRHCWPTAGCPRRSRRRPRRLPSRSRWTRTASVATHPRSRQPSTSPCWKPCRTWGSMRTRRRQSSAFGSRRATCRSPSRTTAGGSGRTPRPTGWVCRTWPIAWPPSAVRWA